MKRNAHLSTISFFIFQIGLAQTNEKLQALFYNLPLDSSPQMICNSLKSDKRFTEIVKNKSQAASEPTYIGYCNSPGLIRSKTDSIRIELGFGKGVIPDSDKLLKTKII